MAEEVNVLTDTEFCPHLQMGENSRIAKPYYPLRYNHDIIIIITVSIIHVHVSH